MIKVSGIKIDALSKSIQDNLKYQTNEIKSKVNKTTKKVAQETKSIIEKSSPVGRRGLYSKSWKVKKLKDGTYLVHSQKQYRLTHLLENGHILRNGKTSKAIAHISIGEEYAKNELPQRIEKVLKDNA